jgi:hypothetical protein
VTPRPEHAGAVSIPYADKAGLLVIRIWVEHSAPLELRARLTSTLDLSSRDELVTTAGSVKEIEDLVRTWLEAFSLRSGAVATRS